MALSDYFEKEQPRIVVTDVTRSTMLEMARWTKFLGIFGLVVLCLMIIGGVFLALKMSFMGYAGNPALASFGFIGYFLLYLLIAAVEFYPIYALLKYSSNIRAALQHNNQEQFDKALGYLKSMYRYIGVVAIILIGIYALFFIFLMAIAAIR